MSTRRDSGTGMERQGTQTRGSENTEEHKT